MKKLIIINLILFITTLFANNITFFNYNDYKNLLNKYNKQIENNTFKADVLINDVKDINSFLIPELISNILEIIKIKSFFNPSKSYNKNIKKLEIFLNKIQNKKSIIMEDPLPIIYIYQFIAKRAYTNSPYHHPITNWELEKTNKEPFTIGIIGSHENIGLKNSYATWYRLAFTFDITELVSYQNINILSAYLRIKKVKSRWGIGDSNGISIGALLTTVEISLESLNFNDLDNLYDLKQIDGKLTGYGTSKESIIFDITDYLKNSDLNLDDNILSFVVPFEPLSDKDFGNRFYSQEIYPENIELIIRYETIGL